MNLFKPLDNISEEIRVISIADRMDELGAFIDCTMETVSLNDWTPAYEEFRDDLEDRLISSMRLYDDWTGSLQSSLLGFQHHDEGQFRFRWGDYETLSYAWGSADGPSYNILINGKEYKVRQNLYDALLQFRTSLRHSSGMKLWVDAICINQSDDLERAVQVKRMRQIYSTATRTIVWLGKDLGPEYSQVIKADDYMRQLKDVLTRTLDLIPEDLSESDKSSGIEDSSDLEDISDSQSGELFSTSSGPGKSNRAICGGSESCESDGGVSWLSDSEQLDLRDMTLEEQADLTTARETSYKVSSSTSSEEGVSTEVDERTTDTDEEAAYQRELLLEDKRRLIAQLDNPGLVPHYPPSTTSTEYESFTAPLALILHPILSNEYWGRVWIIQELAVSSARTEVLLGSSSLELALLFNIQKHLFSSILGFFVRGWILNEPSSVLEDTFKFVMLAIQIKDPDDRPLGWMSQGLCSRSTLISDKFYGILCFMNSEHVSETIVDYTRPVDKVSIDATLALIKKTRRLVHLTLCNYTGAQTPGHPSWAIDLSDECYRVADLYTLDSPSVWEGPKVGASSLNQLSHSKTLLVRGRVIDEIDGTSFYSESLLPQTPPGRHRKNLDYSISSPTSKAHGYGTTAMMLEALNRLLVERDRDSRSLTIFHWPMLAIEEDRLHRLASFPEGMSYETAMSLLLMRHFCDGNAEFNLWGIRFGCLFPGFNADARERVSASQKSAYRALSYLRPSYDYGFAKFNDRILRRRLISTKKGLLGSAAPFATKGDRICILEGCGSLVILRPVGENFEFVGLADVIDENLEDEAEKHWYSDYDEVLKLM